MLACRRPKPRVSWKNNSYVHPAHGSWALCSLRVRAASTPGLWYARSPRATLPLGSLVIQSPNSGRNQARRRDLPGDLPGHPGSCRNALPQPGMEQGDPWKAKIAFHFRAIPKSPSALAFPQLWVKTVTTQRFSDTDQKAGEVGQSEQWLCATRQSWRSEKDLSETTKPCTRTKSSTPTLLLTGFCLSWITAMMETLHHPQQFIFEL